MEYDNLRVDRDGQIALVTLARPEKLNAIDRHLHQEMMAACEELRDDDGVRVVIFTGEGRGFCSGADLTGARPNDEHASRGERLDEYNWVGRQALMVYRDLNKPTIAAVNGVAAGAGMGLALACDMRVGCENSRFKTVFIERSLSPDSGLSYFLPRIVGASRAFDLVFTSRTVDAEEAFRLGLLDRLTSSENLLGEAMDLAKQIAMWPPVAMQMSKRALQRSLDTTLDDQLQYETHSIVFARRAPHDVAEAAASFRERRPPVFTGE
ncbi:MAG: enoyl-CoA hydratase/isomerase family protein [Chloroflexota bacterium]|nr:enoyl-CoA hydratase/isomerase family protein [Chloroflexota bacterium]MDE2960592.1 enoyl-CoA hydratase/isomerase family protein [Chloroflexota bacterium]